MVKCASCGKLLRVKVSGSIEASIQFSFVDFFSHLGWIFEKNFEKYISLNSGLDKRVYAHTCLVMETADEEECCW